MIIDPAVDGLRTLTRGFSLVGNVRSCLYEAAGLFGVSFVTQFNSLFIGSLNSPAAGNSPSYEGTAEAVVLNHESGLLGWPTVIWETKREDILDAEGNQKVDADGTKITKALTFKSIQVDSLLQPAIKLGSVVKIESLNSDVTVGEGTTNPEGITNESINGFYVVNFLRHHGTTAAEDDFTTVIGGSAYP
jgi:hypothetical protein